MIDDVDASLRLLLKQGGPQLSGVDVAFDAPTNDWAGRRSAPTINVYLYDLREDPRRRAVGRIDERDGGGRVVVRRKAPRFFRLAYLLTAWTARPEDEHRLLSDLLRCLIRFDHLPPDARVGSLGDATDATTLSLGRPGNDERAISEVWSALGGSLKPSLDLVVSAPVDADLSVPVAPSPREAPIFAIGRMPESPTEGAGAGASADSEAPGADEPTVGGRSARLEHVEEILGIDDRGSGRAVRVRRRPQP